MEFSSLFKRKSREINSPPTKETVSPENKRLKEGQVISQDHVLSAIVSTSSVSTSSDPEDEILSALSMADNLGPKIDEIFSKLSQLDSISSQIKSLQESVDKINQTVAGLQVEFNCLKQDVKDAVQETSSLKSSVKFLNEEVEAGKIKLQDSEEKTQSELEKLRLQLLDYEIYNRRENLRFYGIPEEDAAEATEEILYNFLERELNIESARSIEFQRVHRIGKKNSNASKPRVILARFLRFKEREALFARRRFIDNESGYGFGPDLPKKVFDMRRKLIPKMEEARAQGKRAAFSRAEPYKLLVDGVEIK